MKVISAALLAVCFFTLPLAFGDSCVSPASASLSEGQDQLCGLDTQRAHPATISNVGVFPYLKSTDSNSYAPVRTLPRQALAEPSTLTLVGTGMIAIAVLFRRAIRPRSVQASVAVSQQGIRDIEFSRGLGSAAKRRRPQFDDAYSVHAKRGRKRNAEGMGATATHHYSAPNHNERERIRHTC